MYRLNHLVLYVAVTMGDDNQKEIKTGLAKARPIPSTGRCNFR
jgi:hypothetical protein